MNENILEKDIEEAILDGQLLLTYGIKIVGRQVGSIQKTAARNGKKYQCSRGGIVDLIGYHAKSRTWVIIEIKRGVLDSSAFTQLSRYMSSAREISRYYSSERMGRRPRVAGLLIGLSYTDVLNFVNVLSDAWFPSGDDIPCRVGNFLHDGNISMLIFTAEVNLEVSI